MTRVPSALGVQHCDSTLTVGLCFLLLPSLVIFHFATASFASEIPFVKTTLLKRGKDWLEE